MDWPGGEGCAKKSEQRVKAGRGERCCRGGVVRLHTPFKRRKRPRCLSSSILVFLHTWTDGEQDETGVSAGVSVSVRVVVSVSLCPRVRRMCPALRLCLAPCPCDGGALRALLPARWVTPSFQRLHSRTRCSSRMSPAESRRWTSLRSTRNDLGK